MPLAIAAVVILLATGVGLLAVGFNSRIYSIRTAADITARCAADAGLTMALYQMNQKLLEASWSNDTLPAADDVALLGCDATYSYQVAFDGTGGYTVQSLGQSGGAHRSVTATLRLMSAFEHAVLTRNKLTLKAGTLVDAYNSADPSDTDLKTSIATQAYAAGSIVLNNGVVVNGDIGIPRGGSIDTVIKDLGATVGHKLFTGLTPLPQVTAPSLASVGSLTVKGATTTLTPADSGRYTSVSLSSTGIGKPGILQISGGDVVMHVTGNIDLGNSAEILVQNGSTLTLYVDGNVVSDNSSSISHEGSPQAPTVIKIYATGSRPQTLNLRAKGNWTGVVWGPNATVTLRAGADVYGAVVADRFEFKAGGNFHYDKALRQADTDDDAVTFVVSRWSEGQAASFE